MVFNSEQCFRAENKVWVWVPSFLPLLVWLLCCTLHVHLWDCSVSNPKWVCIWDIHKCSVIYLKYSAGFKVSSLKMFELTFPVNICAHIKCSWTEVFLNFFFAFISLGMNLLSGFLWKQSLWPGSLFLPLPQLLVIGQRVQNLTLQASRSPESGPFSFQPSSSSQCIKHPNSHKRKYLEILTVGKTSTGTCIFLVWKSVIPKRDPCKAKHYYFLVHVY